MEYSSTALSKNEKEELIKKMYGERDFYAFWKQDQRLSNNILDRACGILEKNYTWGEFLSSNSERKFPDEIPLHKLNIEKQKAINKELNDLLFGYRTYEDYFTKRKESHPIHFKTSRLVKKERAVIRKVLEEYLRAKIENQEKEKLRIKEIKSAIRKEKIGAAIKIIKKSLKENEKRITQSSDNVVIDSIQLAELMRYLEKQPKAIEFLNIAEKYKPNFALIHQLKAQAYFEMGNDGEAFKSKNRALECEPNYYEAWDLEDFMYYANNGNNIDSFARCKISELEEKGLLKTNDTIIKEVFHKDIPTMIELTKLRNKKIKIWNQK